jgi:hypothetical protein
MGMIITSRPAEHMHDRKCAVSATISVLENWRDDNSVTDSEVIFALQDNVWYIAREYLQTGGAICQCPPCTNVCCEHLTGEGENIRFKAHPDDH